MKNGLDENFYIYISTTGKENSFQQIILPTSFSKLLKKAQTVFKLEKPITQIKTEKGIEIKTINDITNGMKLLVYTEKEKDQINNFNQPENTKEFGTQNSENNIKYVYAHPRDSSFPLKKIFLPKSLTKLKQTCSKAFSQPILSILNENYVLILDINTIIPGQVIVVSSIDPEFETQPTNSSSKTFTNLSPVAFSSLVTVKENDTPKVLTPQKKISNNLKNENISNQISPKTTFSSPKKEKKVLQKRATSPQHSPQHIQSVSSIKKKDKKKLVDKSNQNNQNNQKNQKISLYLQDSQVSSESDYSSEEGEGFINASSTKILQSLSTVNFSFKDKDKSPKKGLDRRSSIQTSPKSPPSSSPTNSKSISSSSPTNSKSISSSTPTSPRSRPSSNSTNSKSLPSSNIVNSKSLQYVINDIFQTEEIFSHINDYSSRYHP